MARAIYPGSFDPITNGHLDILERGSHVFDEVVVAVLVNTSKRGLFSHEERVAMIREVTAHLPNVTVDAFSGLTAEYARQRGAQVLIRGLRAVSDFDSELRLALTNKKLNPGLETVFLMTSAENLFLSSSTIKELVALGGSPQGMVPDQVVGPLTEKLRPSGGGAG
ncbi:MAG: pantetheine-phosphate adenylyltransferase [Candidatus Sericytochromatia bacterium]|nr:pantetheine-phosphate adenylyltransferase [Candidatus Sericytochromatia bacterium]